MRQTLTSYDNKAVGSGSIVNDNTFVYNDFSQLTTEYQSHSGAVNMSTTAKVQYIYANGSANQIRATGMVYPSGRVLTYAYGSTGSQSDRLSRVASYIDDDGTSHIVDYTYLGAGSFVEGDRPQPQMKWTLVDLSGTNDPDTGDIYTGLDRFGRVKDNRWYGYGTSTDLDRIQYGYDRAGNRIWRRNTVAAALGKEFDEIYTYDGVHRLKDMARGLLNTSRTALTSTTFAQCWTLDATGNWSGFREDDTGDGTWDLVQARSANDVNEITGITNSVGSAWVQPAYSPAGNMTTMPQPNDPTKGYTATYDAWNRLVKIVDTPTSNTVSEYAYDGAKRQIRQKNYDSGTLTETRHLYYTDLASWRCLEERLGPTSDSTPPDRQFVWGSRYIDDLILRDRSVTSSSSSSSGGGGPNPLGERLFVCQDTVFSISLIAFASHGVAFRVEYTPFGVLSTFNADFTGDPSTSYDWYHFFQGLRSINSRITDARNRFASPVVGFWTTRDEMHSQPNMLYEYLDGNPYGNQDPFGLSPIFPPISPIPPATPINLIDDILVALRQLPGLIAMIPLWARIGGTAVLIAYILWLMAQRIASCMSGHQACLRKADGASRWYDACVTADIYQCKIKCGPHTKIRFNKTTAKSCHKDFNRGACTSSLLRCLLTGTYPPSLPISCGPNCGDASCECCPKGSGTPDPIS